MIKDCQNTKQVSRDGTTQQQRLLQALLPSYVAVDERNMEDLITFAEEYAKEIYYYDNSDNTDGDWVAFFKDKLIREDESKTEPHYALFIAFLDMFRVAQNDINSITERHLEFYYKDVLHLEEKPEVADQVHVIFELAKRVESALIEKGTLLRAGKDDNGNNLFYEVDEDIVINKAQVTDVKNIFANVTPQTPNNGRVYGSPIANSEDGFGEEITDDSGSWLTFGANSRTQSEIGFAVSSPMLRLAEGDRTINFKLNFSASIGESLANNPTNFKILFSGAEEWIEVDSSNISISPLSVGNSLTITVSVSEAVEAIVDYNKELLLDPYETKWPVAKILFRTDQPGYEYLNLKGAVIDSMDIDIDVKKVRNIIVQNDDGVLDNSKPFFIFGGQPIIGSRFYIGSWEILQKQLTEVCINLSWNGLPTDLFRGFQTYYASYISNTRTNQSFKAGVSILDDKAWNEVLFGSASNTRLFDSTSPASAVLSENKFDNVALPVSTADILETKRKILINDASVFNSIGRDVDQATFRKFDNSTQRGFIRLELEGTDFGHLDYGPSLTEKTLEITDRLARELPITNVVLPRQPYTPEIQEISLDYKASQVGIPLQNIALSDAEEAYNNRVEQFFHVSPFGVAERHRYNLVEGDETTVYLLPQFNNEGELFIGMTGLVPAQNVSLLFQIDEGSSNPDLIPPTISWSYLDDNVWMKINPLTDTTSGLLTTGIISFDIPQNATGNNTLLPSGQHWIRATVPDNASAIARVIFIQSQAVKATFQDNGNDPARLANPLPAETISKLRQFDSSISKINQPFASFGGAIAETNEAFFTRTSERLRHKGRGINLWDYEHLVLQEFPEVYKVKTLNTTRFTGSLAPSVYSETAPGHVTTVAVSKVINRNGVDPLKPKTSLVTLTKIKESLQPVTPPCIELHVKNPVYEEVLVSFNVKFLDGVDKGFFEKKLNEDLIGFFAPWTLNTTTDISFGGIIHSSQVINFIEELSYVDIVFCFKMFQIIPTDPTDPTQTVVILVEEAQASAAVSILTSASKHQIKVAETEAECEDCEDNLIAVDGQLVVGEEECGCDDTDDGDDCANVKGIGVMIVEGLDRNKFKVD